MSQTECETLTSNSSQVTLEEEPPGSSRNLFSLPVLFSKTQTDADLAASRREPLSRLDRPPSRPVTTPQTRKFRRTYFPDVSLQDWNDWRWQSRHRIRTLAQFEKMLVLSDEEREALVERGSMLPVGITPYYMSLISRL